MRDRDEGFTFAGVEEAMRKVENSILSVDVMPVANSDIPILLQFHLYAARVLRVYVSVTQMCQ